MISLFIFGYLNIFSLLLITNAPTIQNTTKNHPLSGIPISSNILNEKDANAMANIYGSKAFINFFILVLDLIPKLTKFFQKIYVE